MPPNPSPSIQPPDKPDNGFICSPAALFLLLRYYKVEYDLNNVLAAVSNKELGPGTLDPEAAAGHNSCPNNPVCTSLQIIEKVARNYAKGNRLQVDAGENWTQEDIMRFISEGLPVMVNYGGDQNHNHGRYGHSIIIYGYNFDAGTIDTLDPLLGRAQTRPWAGFAEAWGESDYGDKTRILPGGDDYAPYHNWALVIFP